MSARHVIIDTGHVTGAFERVPGCAVCGLIEALCAKHPVCKGASGGLSIAPADQKTVARARARRARRRR